MKKFKTVLYPSVFFSMLLLLSCTTTSITNSNISEQTPEGFSNPNLVLLIQKKSHRFGLNRKQILIDNSFRKYYTGKYEIVSPEELCMNSKYKDKKTYRYIFHDEIIEAPAGSALNYTINYHLYDRIIDKKITVNIDYNLPAEAPDAIAKKLNKYLSMSKGIVSAH